MPNGDPLLDFLASRGGKSDVPTPEAERDLLEELGPPPPFATSFLNRFALTTPEGRRTIPGSLFRALLAARPQADQLGPNFDFKRLGLVAEREQDKLPEEVYIKMMALATVGAGRQSKARITSRQAFQAAGLEELSRFTGGGLAVQALTRGLVQPPTLELEPGDLSPAGESIARGIGAMSGIMLAGRLTVGVFSKTTLLPKVGPLIAKLPQRVREVSLGVGTGAVLEAARPDGLPEDPLAIDVPARLAHPLSRFLGGGEVAERVSLALTGGAVGGVVGEVLGPVIRGIYRGRAEYFIFRDSGKIAGNLTPEMRELIRTRLNEAGIGVTTAETDRAVVAKLLRNADRVRLSEKMAGSLADEESRLEYIMNQLYSDPAFSGPPRLPKTAVVNEQGQPIRVYRGVRAAGERTGNLFYSEDPQRASFFATRGQFPPVAEAPELAPRIVEGARVEPAYLDLRRPLDLIAGPPPDELLKALDIPLIQAPGVLREQEAISRTVQQVILNPEKVAAAAKKLGYDGVKFLDQPIGTTGQGSYLVFDPKQAVPAGVSHDAQYIAGVFRANPGGLSIAKGVTDVRAADEVVKRLGLNVVTMRAGDDLLIMRPKVTFQERAYTPRVQKQADDFATYVRAANRGKPATRITVMPDGTVIRGEYNPVEMVTRYKLKPPVLEGAERPDLAIREHFGIMDVSVRPGGVVEVNLPSTVTQRQANLLSRMADRGPPEMVLNSARAGETRAIASPFGMQVTDALADLVQGATKPKITADMVVRAQQYQKEGVFAGQAAVLEDGYPVEVLRRVKTRKGEVEILYRDPLTKAVHRTPEDNITVLGTSLEGELAPSMAIFDAMEPAEREALAALRRGINEGLARPINSFSQLESFASTRGFFVTNLGKGQIQLHNANTGEIRRYDSYKAAINAVKRSVGPMPDLTPPEIEELLGFKPNIGTVGGGGPPHRFGEPVAITADEFDRLATTNTLGKLVPGAVEQFLEPTRGLMATLERRYNIPFLRVFLNLQTGTVHRSNFVAAWAYGQGPGLPEGVMPLTKIYKLAGGKGANQRLVTAWLESEGDDVSRLALERQMRPNEVQAAKELRKWYGIASDRGLFAVFGVESEFLTNYAPHVRTNADKYGNDVAEIWRRTRGTPLPKAIDFFADYARDGTMNIYEERAFVAAAQYLNAGARSRFMNTAMDEAKRLLRAIPDNGVKAPLAHYIEALRGSEFASQRAALTASYSRLMRSLGAAETTAKDIGERLTDNLLGLGYLATMGFRPGLAIRNTAQIFQTTWPLVGRLDDTFAEAIGRALTRAGRDEAVRAGAISIKQMALFAGEEVTAAMPAPLRAMSEMGMKLYDSADVFARAVSFHTSKLQAQRAIQEFGESLAAGKNLAEAQRALIKRSGAMVLDKPLVDDFLRRVATSPESAAEFMGKNIADITQYLYGRGNQPRWMRSVAGRFFGQYGTWSLWYVDYMRRSFGNIWRNGYHKEAMAFLGKIALVDTAILSAGAALGLDLRRWMAGNSIFYTGGPAVQAVVGMTELVRGASEEFLGTYESPATRQRLARGTQLLERVGLAFVPGMYATRDLNRLINASSQTERLAAVLSVYPSTDYTVQQKLDLLFNPGRLSTDIDLETRGEMEPTAVELILRGMQVGQERPRIQVPGGPLPPQPQLPEEAGAGEQPVRGRRSVRVTAPVSPPRRPPGGQPLQPTALPLEIRRGESKPVP